MNLYYEFMIDLVRHDQEIIEAMMIADMMELSGSITESSNNKNILNKIVEWIKAQIDKLIQFIKKIKDKIVGFFENMSDKNKIKKVEKIKTKIMSSNVKYPIEFEINGTINEEIINNLKTGGALKFIDQKVRTDTSKIANDTLCNIQRLIGTVSNPNYSGGSRFLLDLEKMSKKSLESSKEHLQKFDIPQNNYKVKFTNKQECLNVIDFIIGGNKIKPDIIDYTQACVTELEKLRKKIDNIELDDDYSDICRRIIKNDSEVLALIQQINIKFMSLYFNAANKLVNVLNSKIESTVEESFEFEVEEYDFNDEFISKSQNSLSNLWASI